jgi:hypothetical protein
VGVEPFGQLQTVREGLRTAQYFSLIYLRHLNDSVPFAGLFESERSCLSLIGGWTQPGAGQTFLAHVATSSRSEGART